MSKAAKTSVYILMVLLIAALGFAFVTFTNLRDTESQLQTTQREFADARQDFKTKEQMQTKKIQEAQDSIAKLTGEKTELTNKVQEVQDEIKKQSDFFSGEIETITEDRDKWKRRIETIREERDKLMAKITELNDQLDKQKQTQLAAKETKAPAVETPPDVKMAPGIEPDSGRAVDEEYWANLLKQKASLEIEVRELKDELSARSIELVEMKQVNENLQLEVNSAKSEKDEIQTEAQHRQDMLDNLSLELARTKNDKKFISNRMEKINQENEELRQKMKKLVSVKNALEKSIVKVTQEKDKVENKLGRTETMIQSKIDEIWDIKDELDQSIRSTRGETTPGEVELPPIVVKSSGETENFNTGESAPSYNGQVISVNEPNNFVIVDIGEKSGVRLGDQLSVYRDSKYIARLEVIQVREDISAADLKDQWSKIQVGDIIR